MINVQKFFELINLFSEVSIEGTSFVWKNNSSLIHRKLFSRQSIPLDRHLWGQVSIFLRKLFVVIWENFELEIFDIDPTKNSSQNFDRFTHQIKLEFFTKKIFSNIFRKQPAFLSFSLFRQGLTQNPLTLKRKLFELQSATKIKN